MKNILYTTTRIVAIGLLFASCDKFLDEVPDTRTEIDTPEKVQELLVSAYPNALYMDIAETMSDNAGDKISLTETSILNTELYQWKDSKETRWDAPTFYWGAAWGAIASANHALEAVEKLGGGSSLNYLKGEALVARAYAHFMLGLLWCKPYNPATASSDLGLPYVTAAEKVVFAKYTRLSVEEYYKAIEKDLEEGLPLIDNTSYSKPKFHFTKEAAHIFATRFYLVKGEWAKVIAHANEALGSNPAAKVRDINKINTLTTLQRQVQYSSTSEPSNALITGASSVYQRNLSRNKYGMTATLSVYLSQRSLHPLDMPWAYDFQGGNENIQNIPKYQEYFKVNNVSAGTGYPYGMATLLLYDEALLNRMEAYVMTGQTAKFIEDLKVYLPFKTGETLDVNNITETALNTKYNGKGTELSPAYTLTTPQRQMLQCLLDLRRIEFVFEGLRWFDIKRFGLKVIHQKGNQTLELNKGDLRRELQIPEDALAAGITPNPR